MATSGPNGFGWRIDLLIVRRFHVRLFGLRSFWLFNGGWFGGRDWLTSLRTTCRFLINGLYRLGLRL